MGGDGLMKGFKFYINMRNGATYIVRALCEEHAIQSFLKKWPYGRQEIWNVKNGGE
jgi:hypothetical protein